MPDQNRFIYDPNESRREIARIGLLFFALFYPLAGIAMRLSYPGTYEPLYDRFLFTIAAFSLFSLSFLYDSVHKNLPVFTELLVFPIAFHSLWITKINNFDFDHTIYLSVIFSACSLAFVRQVYLVVFVVSFNVLLWTALHFSHTTGMTPSILISAFSGFGIFVLIDLLQRMRVGRNLSKAKHEAETSNRVKRQFMANMSHEIRTPLNGMLGLTDLAIESRNPEEIKNFLQDIKYSGQNLLTILNEILDFSQIELNRMQLKNDPFSFRETIRRLAQLYKYRADEKGIRIETEIDPEIHDTLAGDQSRIAQILSNLIHNAIKFTDHGHVHIKAQLQKEVSRPDLLIIDVADTGIGIDDEHKQAIFNEFTQADSSSTRKYGGSGLGLTISSRLASLMRGNLTLLKSDSSGSVFRFQLPYIPLNSQSVVQNEPVDRPNMEQSDTPLKVLIAEDDEISRTVVRRLLQSQGHAVSEAKNGREAYEMAVSDKFDLIFMDIQMPEMDGLEATRRIRSAESENRKDSRTPIIGLTAHALKEEREACFTAGMDEHLSKPLEMDRLFRLISEITSSGNIDLNYDL